MLLCEREGGDTATRQSIKLVKNYLATMRDEKRWCRRKKQ